VNRHAQRDSPYFQGVHIRYIMPVLDAGYEGMGKPGALNNVLNREISIRAKQTQAIG